MANARTRTFRSGNSEAVRLPKDVAFGVDVDLTVVRSGDVVTMFPTRPSIDRMVEKLRSLPSPDSIEDRDSEIPERPGM